MSNVPREGRLAFWWTAAGVLFAAGFTVWALTASVYSSGATLLQANEELMVRVVLAFPFACALGTWLVLHLACRRDSRALRTLGILLATLVGLLALLGAMTVGIAIVPTAIALLIGALFTPVHGRTVV